MRTAEYFPYEDIIDIKWPREGTPSRKRMSMEERAAQFAPFAALTGYGDAVREMAEDHNQRVSRETEREQI